MALFRCVRLQWSTRLHHSIQNSHQVKNLRARCLSYSSAFNLQDHSARNPPSSQLNSNVAFIKPVGRETALSHLLPRTRGLHAATGNADDVNPAVDVILTSIEGIKNADELHSLLETTGVDQIRPVHVAAALEKLTDVVYKDLERYPWFQSQNRTIGYIQLMMNKSLQPFTEELRDHRVFKLLKKLAYEHFDEFNGLEHSSVLLSLARLGIDLEDDLCVKFLVRTPDLCDDACFQTLVNFSSMQLSVNRRNPILIHKLLEKLRRDLDTLGLEEDVNSFENMAVLLISVSYLMSESLCKSVLDKVMLILDQNPQILQDPKMLGLTLRLVRRVIIRFPPDKVNYQTRLFSHCENALNDWEGFSVITDNHIAEICSNLQFAMRYHSRYAEKFRKRSMELLSEKISVVSNLSYAFDSSTPPQQRREIETALFNTIDDADLLILSNLAESLRLMNCTNDDLIERFQEKVIENLDGIFEYVTRFEKIIRCLLWKNFINPENERIFVESLLQCLNGRSAQFSSKLWCIGMAATYLLQHTSYVMPEVLYKKLVDVIPQCSVKDLYPVMIAMNSFKKPMAASTENQLYHLQTITYANIIERLDTIYSINLLTSMLRDLIFRSKSPDANLVEKLMNLYVKFSQPEVVNVEKYTRIIGIHSRLCYRNPPVLDNLAVFAVANVQNLEMRKLLNFCLLLTKVAYVPKDMDSLVEATMQRYEEEKDKMKVPERIQLFRNLAELQIFPEKQIKDIFSLDFIQRVDKHIADNPDSKQGIEWHMMNLNRLVVLECPELDVPWFHEQYCQENMALRNVPGSLFTEQVGDILTEILGGWQFVRKWVFTPYFHTINFEAVIDNDGKPANLVQMKTPPENSQRLAVRTLFSSQYCYNSRELNGFEKAKQRHLQLLGYKVVEVPLYEWNSMSLSDKDSKVEYIKHKLFA